MPKTSKGSWILVIIFLVFLSMLGLWCMDIGASAMITKASIDGISIETGNGLWTRSPIHQYHLGLLFCILPVLALAFISARAVLNEIPGEDCSA